MEQENTTETPKQRHGCLTTWLILMILANSFTAVFNLWSAPNTQRLFPRFPLWGIWGLALMGALNVLFALALFRWKRWGFFGFCCANLITCGLNIYGGIGVIPSVVGLIGVVILFGVLQLGGQNKGWPQLE